MVSIIPAILQLQRDDLEGEIRRLSMISPFLHIDVTGALVDAPAVVFSPNDLAEVLNDESLGVQYQIHLMVSHDELEQWLNALASVETVSAVIIHHEIGSGTLLFCQEIRSANQAAIVAINPDTPLDVVDGYVGMADGILVMGVVPGAQGKAFEPETLSRIAHLHKKYPQLTIMTDGAVSLEDQRAQALVSAGATTLVVGSQIRDAHDPQAVYDAFTAAVNQ